MKIYIAGPMSGLPEYNYPAFHSAAKTLRARGFEVKNPAEISINLPYEWAGCMRKAITQLLCCECVVLLPGWEKSKGATLEYQIACDLGLRIVLFSDIDLLG